jgi:hypothetical protein
VSTPEPTKPHVSPIPGFNEEESSGFESEKGDEEGDLFTITPTHGLSSASEQPAYKSDVLEPTTLSGHTLQSDHGVAKNSTSPQPSEEEQQQELSLSTPPAQTSSTK